MLFFSTNSKIIYLVRSDNLFPSCLSAEYTGGFCNIWPLKASIDSFKVSSVMCSKQKFYSTWISVKFLILISYHMVYLILHCLLYCMCLLLHQTHSELSTFSLHLRRLVILNIPDLSPQLKFWMDQNFQFKYCI